MEHQSLNSGIAIVVPVLGDVDALSALLRQIDAWPATPEEIIVISAKQHPALDDLCRDRGCRLIDMHANRGAQLDRGAREARAQVLWFMHADVLAPPDGSSAIESALACGAESGCFRFEFQGSRTWYKSLLARLVALRVFFGGIPYGDQSIFVRRDVYAECGGFPHQPLFEEVRLVKRLRKRGTFRPLPGVVRVSTRRWERDGWWSRTWRNRWLALCYMFGISAERLASSYHSRDDAGTRHDT